MDIFRREEYARRCAWPTDCFTQWGSTGVVFTKNGSYTTAFFEAFPKDGGFIRGEGATIEEAERQAFRQYEKESVCVHRFGRQGYLNGMGKCYRCGALKRAFKPVHVLKEWWKPLDKSETSFLKAYVGKVPLMSEGRKWLSILHLRAKIFGTSDAKH